MIIKIILKKLHLNENKYIEAFIYGSFYFFMTLIIFLFYLLLTQRGRLIMYFVYSLGIGIVMSLVYLIKNEVMKHLKG